MMPVRITPTVKILLIICGASFIVQQTIDQFFGGHLLEFFGLIPAQVINGHRFWQVFTYAFLHGDVMHLALNMLVLALVGSELEAVWGRAFFIRYSLVCSTFAGLVYLFLQLLLWDGAGLHTPMVGASGAIYGHLIAYGLLFGERMLLFMMLFPMKAKHFIWVIAGVEFLSSLFSGRNGLAATAHLAGMAAGFSTLWARAMFRIYRKKGPKAPKAGRGFRKNHLKLVIDNEQDQASKASRFEDENDPRTWH